jgi:hypothetical protein
VQKNYHLAASAALVFLAVALRLGYAWRVGVSPRADLLIAGAASVLAVGAVAARLGGPGAAAAASLIWAALPAAVVANTFFPRETYAALAGVASLYYFLKFREDQKPSSGSAAGLLAGVAVAFSFSYLTLAAFYLFWAVARAPRKNGPGVRAFLWLGGFAVVLAVAAVLEYLRVGEPFAHLRAALAATPDAYFDAKLLVKRLGADAAAMLFWDPLGFGFVGVVALAAAVYYFGARGGAGRFLAAFLVFALAALNFSTTTFRGYAPMPLEPTKWLAASLPAAALAGAAAGGMWSADGGLGRWAGSLGAAAVLAILFVNGNMPYATANLAVLGLASLGTLALAGLARRGGERERRRCARAAAAITILISILAIVILYS